MTELEEVRRARQTANDFLDDLPATLRMAAVEGACATILIPSWGLIPLAARLEKGAAARPLIVVRPKTALEDQLDRFWHRLCGCFFLSVPAVLAAEAIRDLLGPIR